MPTYECQLCAFSSQILSHYKRHCNTAKHIKNLTIYGINDDECMFCSKNEPKMSQNKKKMSQNEPKMSQNEPKCHGLVIKVKNTIQLDDNRCKYCNKSYSSKATKRRHEMHRCKFRNEMQLAVLEEENDHKDLIIMKQKEKINELIQLSGVGGEKKFVNMNSSTMSNSMNTTNNIIINNYGSEDLSHLTSPQMVQLLKAPHSMVGNLFKKIYFNNEKPENRTIKMTNKKEALVQIRQNNAWQLEQFGEIVPDLCTNLYQMLVDFFFDNGSEALSDRQRGLLEKYVTLYEDHDDEVMKPIMKTFKMIMLNYNMREKQRKKSE